jgi:nucleotide-binding universal stress UspA family protein
LGSSDDETLRQAALLTASSNGGLHVCHCPGEPRSSATANAALLERTELTLRRWTAERIVDAAVADRTVLHSALGPPADALIELAAELDADVIVVGRPRRGKFTKLVAKPVALQLAQWAPCPIWVAAVKDYAGLARTPAPVHAATARLAELRASPQRRSAPLVPAGRATS